MKSDLLIQGKKYYYFPLSSEASQQQIQSLPYSLRILLENFIRLKHNSKDKKYDGFIKTLLTRQIGAEIAFNPSRILMQDFTGVPAIVDLATMRDEVRNRGGDPTQVNPLIPVDLVVDHSVIVDSYGKSTSLQKNVDLEFSRNHERYTFLKWGQKSFQNFRVVPPGTGICHQVNIEYLAHVVMHNKEEDILYPDIVLGTDSHTTMVNGLSVLGWGVGGIEAEACLLGLSYPMLLPEVVGVKLIGRMPEFSTATDVVLAVTELLRKEGVVGKFVEYFGEGLSSLTLADRATIANMAPEYGATCGFFPIDQETIAYLTLTGRSEEQCERVEQYAKAQHLWYDTTTEPLYNKVLTVDLSTIEPCLAGPKRPQDRVLLKNAAKSCQDLLAAEKKDPTQEYAVKGEDFSINNGDVLIAAITSCTNTSNPYVLVGAALLARKARQAGLTVKPWVKTSFGPGSQVVYQYLKNAGLMEDLEHFGFHLAGYGCTTCIGNSGPFKQSIAETIDQNQLTVCSVLSGNRNFEGRIHPQVKANYLASPLLVVAYAIKGNMVEDISSASLGRGSSGQDVYLKDVWPSQKEIAEIIESNVTREIFQEKYKEVFNGTPQWQKINVEPTVTYQWDDKSTYIRRAPYFDKPLDGKISVRNGRLLALLGDSITTDHISPAGNIHIESPAAKYLLNHNIQKDDFNSYGARRGNHEVMMRGTFGNIRLKNEMVPEKSGGFTKYLLTDEVKSIYDASMRYQEEDIPLVIIAGKEYGTGSSRDWAAKGTNLLGVRAVVAESFERIHRSNLVGMGVMPLEFANGETKQSLNLKGDEIIMIKPIGDGLSPRMPMQLEIIYSDNTKKTIDLRLRIDTEEEIKYFEKGGILNYMVESVFQ